MRFLNCLPTLFAVSLIGLLAMAHGAKAQNVAYIVSDVNLTNAGDQYIFDLLTIDRLFDVTLVSQNANAADTLAASEAADLTVVAESVGSGAIGVELKNSTKPVLLFEPYVYDDHRWVPPGTITNNFAPVDVAGNTPVDPGVGEVFDSLTIVDPDHPMAGGLTGDVPMWVDMDGQSVTGSMSYGRLQTNASVIATIPGHPDAAAIFVHEPGDLDLDGAEIPGLRVGFSGTAIWFQSYLFSEGGLTLFNAALDYALDIQQLNPGDVDGDLDTDIEDYYVIRDNFFMSVASRDEGDLNRDGLVDFRDFRRWKSDPNLVLDGASAAIPEPTGTWLALAAVIGLVVARCRKAQ